MCFSEKAKIGFLTLFFFPFSSLLPSDVEKIQAGIGDKLSIFFQWITTFFAGFVIGFVVQWRLTLVLLGFTPFLVFAAFLLAKV